MCQEPTVHQQLTKQQQEVQARQPRGGACHVAVITVAAVDFHSWSSVALTVGLAAERLVGTRLHHPTWKEILKRVKD